MDRQIGRLVDAIDSLALAEKTLIVLTGDNGNGGSGTAAEQDTDLDTAVLQVVAHTNPSHGTLTINPDGSFAYLHDGGTATEDSFGYRACDSGEPVSCDDATVTISITP